jgi:uncharacterized protein (TIGR00661 family)
VSNTKIFKVNLSYCIKMVRRKIAYGIHGYGLGHTLRSLSIISGLAKDSDIRVFAGGHAHDFLTKNGYDLDVVRIPSLEYVHNEGDGDLSIYRTIKANVLKTLRLLTGIGKSTRKFQKEFDEFAPDAVISDCEAWTRKRAKKLGIPSISTDHTGVLAYCDLDIPPDLKRGQRLCGLGYRLLFRDPDKMIVPNFYPATPKKRFGERVSVIGPVIRDEVKQAEPRDGDHVLVYFRDSKVFPYDFEDYLSRLDRPVKVYGVDKDDHDNISFHQKSDRPFLEDLASCHAVISRAGNQLPGEMLYLGKPGLLLPSQSEAEQKINAHMWEKIGAGMQRDLSKLTFDDLQAFLENHRKFKAKIERMSVQDSTDHAHHLIHQYLQAI